MSRTKRRSDHCVLQGEEASVLREVERTVGKRIALKPDPLLHHEQFDVTAH